MNLPARLLGAPDRNGRHESRESGKPARGILAAKAFPLADASVAVPFRLYLFFVRHHVTH
jgi:hypothetical protein